MNVGSILEYSLKDSIYDAESHPMIITITNKVPSFVTLSGKGFTFAPDYSVPPQNITIDLILTDTVYSLPLSFTLQVNNTMPYLIS